MNIVFPDDIEVQLYDLRDGKRLVAALELISPGNKDRAEARRAFGAKCVAYLQRGIGLVIVDIVTHPKRQSPSSSARAVGPDGRLGAVG